MYWLSGHPKFKFVAVVHIPHVHILDSKMGDLLSSRPPRAPIITPQTRQGARPVATPPARAPRNLPAQLSADTRTETLPPETIAGLRAEGTRITEIIPAGTAGNNREITVISETWTSPVLKITLRQMTDDPRTGKVTTEVTSIDRAAPDPALFKAPEGYAVMELLKTPSPVPAAKR